MKKRRTIISIVLLCIVAVAVMASVFIFGKNAEYVPEVDQKEVKAAYNLLINSLRDKATSYTDFLAETVADFGQGDILAKPEAGIELEDYEGLAVTLDYNETTEYVVETTKPGLYYLVLDYKPMGNTLADFNIAVKINDTQEYDEMGNIAIPLFWMDKTKDFPTDRYGDETAPYQVRKDEWTSLYLYNNTYSTSEPLLFYFEAGRNVIQVTNISGNGLGVGNIKVETPVFNIPAYTDYRSQFTGSLVSALIPINSVDYIEKNTSQAIYSSENNPALTPQDSEFKKINTLTWVDAGSEITYQLNAAEEGLYQVAFHYKNAKEEFDVFNTIKIDGKVPFQELTNYSFESTDNKWENEVLRDEEGKPFEIYLTKGIHTITLRSEQEPIVQAWKYARLIAEHVTQFELELTKITGSTLDDNRTWQMTRYIPEIPGFLAAYATLINEIKYLLQDYTPNGVNSASISELDKAMAFIDQMAEYPDEIALYKINLTKARDNSVLKSVSEFSSKLVTQNFALDMIYVYGNSDLPKPRANVIESTLNSTKTLVNSFVSDKLIQKMIQKY
ncbi:MAG: carbohydrate-binding protein [Mobilitalea sp.]